MHDPKHPRKPSFENRIDIIAHHCPRPIRVIVISTKAFLFYHGTIRAAAMTYTSFLAVVPLLILLTAISLSLGLGSFFNTYLPILDKLFSLGLPLDNIMPILQNTEKIHLKTLGFIGSISLFITFIFAIGNLEMNMNVVWENQTSRSIPKQLLAYTPLLLLGAGFLAFFAAFITHLKKGLFEIANNTIFLEVSYVHTILTAFWIISLNLSIILLIFATIYLLPYRKGNFSYKKLFLPSLGASIAVWGATGIYLMILVFLQKSLFTRMSLFYGSLAFIPLVLLFAFGFWAIVLYGNCLVWTIYSWPRSALKKWDWIQLPEGHL